MKKIKFQKKLSLNKETIAKLNEEQMEQANGGWCTQGCTDGCKVQVSASPWLYNRGAYTGDCWTGNTVAVCITLKHD